VGRPLFLVGGIAVALLVTAFAVAAAGDVPTDLGSNTAVVAAPTATAAVPAGVVVQGKGRVPQPTDFAPAPTSLAFSGDISGLASMGRPNSCGSGGGPSGVIYAYGAYVQLGDNWYLLDASTLPGYKGPGGYTANARVFPFGSNGLGQPAYEGQLQLVVTNDGKPASNAGTLSGTLPKTKGSGHVTVSGSWVCTWSPLLGPG
jgi:hypothetical protein